MQNSRRRQSYDGQSENVKKVLSLSFKIYIRKSKIPFILPETLLRNKHLLPVQFPCPKNVRSSLVALCLYHNYSIPAGSHNLPAPQ